LYTLNEQHLGQNASSVLATAAASHAVDQTTFTTLAVVQAPYLQKL
jgi:hypothetical protein